MLWVLLNTCTLQYFTFQDYVNTNTVQVGTPSVPAEMNHIICQICLTIGYTVIEQF